MTHLYYNKIVKDVIKPALALGLLLGGFAVHAQFIPDPVSLSASPKTPNPGQTVVITASTPTFGANESVFSWIVDGARRADLSGEGKNSIAIAAGELGSTNRIAVDVAGPGSAGGGASLILRASDLALSWFAETYIPKWYKGKALPTQNSVVNVVATPRMFLGGALLPPEKLIYRWGLDDEEKALSGVGKNVFRFQVSDLSQSSHEVKVSIEDSSGQVTKEGRLFIVVETPHVAVYPASPLGGAEFRSSASLFSTSARGLIDFVAEPFYFSVNSKKELPYEWSIGGGRAQGNPDEPYLLSINTGNEPVSVIPVSVSVQSPDKFISAVSKTITLLLQ